ncbi:SNF2-related protein [Thiocapsa marina]|uniref:Helicase domain-containing protein n=1 Tax=Thiocapsa marina 5811 TaxID=768671 RepID=F9UAN6_9GAMM|nr:SNF2-related protein [Thiocapsa marina]EGV18788.1 helicase domain-containing protein [Thiocapsa marina 5811]
MRPGDKVRLKANPGRIGILGNETDGPPHRTRVLVHFRDGDEQFILQGSLEKVTAAATGAYAMMQAGRYGRVSDLRGAITYYRLSGRLANLIYSLNTTNTQFLAYQFKPVLQFLDSPCNGILIADEVGLGKTIEAGLIWTELRARVDAQRLLIVCPSMLREKWQEELIGRFGVQAEIVNAAVLLDRLASLKRRPHQKFALIASIQGIRPPRDWSPDDHAEPSQAPAAQLARFLADAMLDDALLDLVVVDEAHYLRNAETLAHRFARLLRPVTHNLVMLTATPIQLRSRDLFNLLHLIDEDAFPYENSFEETLRANAPVVALRDRILNGEVTQADFVEALKEAIQQRIFGDNEQLDHLLRHPPGDKDLSSPHGRAEISEQLDRVNPLAKVVTRTLKRDVQEMRVQRSPVTIRVEMTPTEREFYLQVTEAVRDFCARFAVSEGFMLTIPQRQMSSCIAAACQGWIARAGDLDDDELEEAVFELFGDADEPAQRPNLGPLLLTLVGIARRVGDDRALRADDTKYAELLANIRRYWETYPDQKIILFSFYRNTLHYLAKRLAADGILSVVLHGGMDKQGALRHFAAPEGPNLLLSSEVAAEGVDLQFSSLLINYDLPWNPARIEQRIGRIDRIGQAAERILIWNFIYAETIDDRIYTRLLERLDVFRHALGSLEAMLGDEIRKLTYELLSHKLTPEQEIARIEQTRLAVETTNRLQEELEEESTRLIAHGDFIQNKVRAARELGRYLRGEDLLAYVRDFLERDYPGTRLLTGDACPLEQTLEFSTEARVAFAEFLTAHQLGGTRILATPPPRLLFENRLGRTAHGVERITQDHPLVRFVNERLKLAGSGPLYCPVSAVELPAQILGSIHAGVYIYAVARWTVSGAREIERLEYLVQGLSGGVWIDGEQAERLVNIAGLEGKDWLGATSSLDHARSADLLDACRTELEARFQRFSQAQARENRDRVNLMVNTLQHHLDQKRRVLNTRISEYQQFGTDRQRRIIPALNGQLNKLQQRIESKIQELRLKEQITSQDSLVSGGVIKVF